MRFLGSAVGQRASRIHRLGRVFLNKLVKLVSRSRILCLAHSGCGQIFLTRPLQRTTSVRCWMFGSGWPYPQMMCNPAEILFLALSFRRYEVGVGKLHSK